MAEDGMEQLKKLKGYNNDASLIAACRNMLNFYKSEASRSVTLSDFFLKQESFAKIKKQFDNKPASKRTQQDIDQYNNAVNDMNAASKSFNATNNELNKERSSALNEWNKTYSKYLDEYMPKQAKVNKKPSADCKGSSSRLKYFLIHPDHPVATRVVLFHFLHHLAHFFFILIRGVMFFTGWFFN
jgi:transketolase